MNNPRLTFSIGEVQNISSELCSRTYLHTSATLVVQSVFISPVACFYHLETSFYDRFDSGEKVKFDLWLRWTWGGKYNFFCSPQVANRRHTYRNRFAAEIALKLGYCSVVWFLPIFCKLWNGSVSCKKGWIFCLDKGLAIILCRWCNRSTVLLSQSGPRAYHRCRRYLKYVFFSWNNGTKLSGQQLGAWDNWPEKANSLLFWLRFLDFMLQLTVAKRLAYICFNSHLCFDLWPLPTQS